MPTRSLFPLFFYDTEEHLLGKGERREGYLKKIYKKEKKERKVEIRMVGILAT